MAKAGNLAALAALGALAYKLNKGDEKAPVRDVATENRLAGLGAEKAAEQPNPMDVLTTGYGEQGMMEKEPGWESKAAPAASAVGKKPMPANTRSMATKAADAAAEVSMADKMAAYKPRYTPPGAAPKLVMGRQYPRTGMGMPDNVDYSVPGMNPNVMGRKKGGVVKAKTSTPSRSSASKRADGIASKGKTRGKIY